MAFPFQPQDCHKCLRLLCVSHAQGTRKSERLSPRLAYGVLCDSDGWASHSPLHFQRFAQKQTCQRLFSRLPAVGIGSIVQQELDHLLMPSAGAVEESGPAVDVLHLQLGTLLQKGQRASVMVLHLLSLCPLKVVCIPEDIETCVNEPRRHLQAAVDIHGYLCMELFPRFCCFAPPDPEPLCWAAHPTQRLLLLC